MGTNISTSTDVEKREHSRICLQRREREIEGGRQIEREIERERGGGGGD